MHRIPLLRIVTMTTIIMSIPFVAMQFTSAVQWDTYDFALAGGLVCAVQIFYHTAMIHIHHHRYRRVVALGMVAVGIFVWLELAVGIVGSPWSGS